MMEIIKKFSFLLFLIIVSSCKSDVNGVYISNLNNFEADTLKLLDGNYIRKRSSKLVCDNKYFIYNNEISFSSWVNQGELPIGNDTMDVSFQLRFGLSGRCNKIIFDSNSGSWYSRINQ